MMGMEVARVTLFILADLYKSMMTSLKLHCLLVIAEGSSTPKGSVEIEVLSNIVTLSYIASQIR